MNITVRKCDFCGVDIRSDSDLYPLFAVLELPDGSRRDVCKGCTDRLGFR